MPTLEVYNQLRKDIHKDKDKDIKPDTPPHDPAPTMYTIPYSVLIDRRFRKALSWAEANGEDMYFEVDDEYRLILR